MVKPKADLIYFDAGGGHRASALALEASMKDKWEVRLVNLRDVLNDLDFIKKWTDSSIENFYNNLMISNYGYIAASKTGLWILQRLINSIHNQIVAKAMTYWRSLSPDIIISLIPNFNRPLFEAASAFHIPYVTVMVDMADCYKHFWLEEQDQYVIVGSTLAYQQAMYKIPSKKVFLVNGQIVHPNFYQTSRFKRKPKNPTALVCFGGYGSNKMLKLETTIVNSGVEIYTKYICGHNSKLKDQLFKRTHTYGAERHGFVSGLDFVRLMQSSDFLIGKPGPGIINEALVSNLPLLLDNTHPMIQEKYNLQWVKEKYFGQVGDITNPNFLINFIWNLPFYKKSIKENYKNDAVFEIPKILERII